MMSRIFGAPLGGTIFGGHQVLEWFKVGQPVEVSAQDAAVLVTAVGEVRLTLAQKLALFDPERHGGEAMATSRVGGEVL